MAPKVMKSKSVGGRRSAPIVRKGTLRSALLSGLKADSGRKDIRIGAATAVASSAVDELPLEQRAGFPLKLKKGAVHPKDWVTKNGVKIIVDTARVPWLPDNWGQGVKQTQPTSHSTGDGGGILTTFVAPDGKTSFFHKATSEIYAGSKFDVTTGWNGQVRRARLESQQALHLARAEGENAGVDNDAALLKLLTKTERACLPAKEELHVGIVSARRASKLEGVRDICMVQCQFEEAGVCPTWYVDAESLTAYKALGLKAVVGGKLTAARNKALSDAKRLGKVCVQVSDDISMWEYRDGAPAKQRTDDACNKAHAAARRLIVSPVTAARFIVAKMRGAESPNPKLGGVYMLGSCARSFCGEAFQRQHFILGDFFVVEPDSTIRFDEEMRLKEDYDFTCSHIAKYGSVMRCNRMTLNVKHYANSGGACTNRDKKGKEEKRNIAILHRKWPGCFRKSPKRRNEVILAWKTSACDCDGDDDDEVKTRGARSSSQSASSSEQHARPSAAAKRTLPKKIERKFSKVKKPHLKEKKTSQERKFGSSSKIVLGEAHASCKTPYIKKRCSLAAGRKVRDVVGSMRFRNTAGKTVTYRGVDLTYDIKSEFLRLRA